MKLHVPAMPPCCTRGNHLVGECFRQDGTISPSRVNKHAQTSITARDDGSTMSRASTSVVQTLRTCKSYPPQSEGTIATQIEHTLHHYPTLHATVDLFTSSEGRSQKLVALRGTIPVSYRNGQYKIPIPIWIMPYHPCGPPVIFVVPTRNMVIRKGHPHVDDHGLVYMPYLHGWNSNSSLVESVGACVAAFSIKPPVYARPGVKSGTSTPYGVESEKERERLIGMLVGRLRERMRESGQRIRDARLAKEMNWKLLEAKRGEGEGMEREVGELQRRKVELLEWVGKHPRGDSVDDMRYRHALMEQDVQCRAKDMALADSLGVLDGVIGIRVEEYLSRVRMIGREMFFQRLESRKVRKQMAIINGQRVERRSSMPVPKDRASHGVYNGVGRRASTSECFS